MKTGVLQCFQVNSNVSKLILLPSYVSEFFKAFGHFRGSTEIYGFLDFLGEDSTLKAVSYIFLSNGYF